MPVARRAPRKMKIGLKGRPYYKKKYAIRRPLMSPSPTFTETFALPRDNLVIPSGSGIGKAFKVSFAEIPQRQQYMNLYTQYRINWVKVMLLPNFDTVNAEVNAAYNGATTTGSTGMARIAWAIQDSPGATDPATEAEVLQDNGAKVKPVGAKWTCSFKPVPDVSQTTTAGTILTKQKYKQWFNYDETLTGNNPLHGAVNAYISVPGSPGTTAHSTSYICYYKVNFSLRDPR